jgi:hypothetical protein
MNGYFMARIEPESSEPLDRATNCLKKGFRFLYETAWPDNGKNKPVPFLLKSYKKKNFVIFIVTHGTKIGIACMVDGMI